MSQATSADEIRRASIEFKSFTHTIKISVRKLAKDHNFSDDMPLACVVEFTGTAAFRAAKKWNSIAEKPSVISWKKHKYVKRLTSFKR